MAATVGVPATIEANSPYDAEGVGFKPGDQLIVSLEHSVDGWHRRREVFVDGGGKFSCHSTSHVAGTIEVSVLRLAEEQPLKHRKTFDILARAEIAVTAAADEGDPSEDQEGGSVANPSDTSETDD